MNKIAIIENSPGLGNYFTKFLEQKEYEIFPVWKTLELPKDKFESYIFTGDFNNISDGLLPIHKAEIEFVETINDKKIFASCFFHQLLGIIFDGTVRKRDVRFLGWYKMVIEKNHHIFDELKDPYFLNLNVDELITQPRTAQILATHPDCKYQVLKIGDHILTCQSHPEVLHQEGLDTISEHRESLLNNCPDLDKLIAQTKDLADDSANEIFMSNITNWLRS